MPRTAFFYLCGSLAICGFPPFNGFISEFLIYSGLIEGIQLENIQFSSLMIICISFLALIGGISLLTFTKSFGNIFLGVPRNEIIHQPKEVSRFMLVPLAVILILMVAIGIFPGLLLAPLSQIITLFNPEIIPVARLSEMFTLLSDIGIASLSLFVLSAVIFIWKKKSEKAVPVTVGPTWGCAYPAPNTRMQYTSKSYSRSLLKLFSFLTLEKKKYREIDPSNIFPKGRSFQSYFLDFFEVKIIQRIIKLLLRYTEYFSFIHNGKIQLYILYGVFFILSLIVITFFHIF